MVTAITGGGVTVIGAGDAGTGAGVTGTGAGATAGTAATGVTGKVPSFKKTVFMS